MKANVESNVNACRRFFALEVEARLVTAGLIELGIEDINVSPDISTLPDIQCWSNGDKKKYLREFATKILDNYVLDKEKHNAFVTACEEMEVKENGQRTGTI